VVTCEVKHFTTFLRPWYSRRKSTALKHFKPPPPVGAGGGYMFSGRPSVPLSVRPCVRGSRGSFMFPRYLQYLLTDFRQTSVTGAPRHRDELIRFWGQKVKVQGHTIAAEAHTFSSCKCFILRVIILHVTTVLERANITTPYIYTCIHCTPAYTSRLLSHGTLWPRILRT